MGNTSLRNTYVYGHTSTASHAWAQASPPLRTSHKSKKKPIVTESPSSNSRRRPRHARTPAPPHRGRAPQPHGTHAPQLGSASAINYRTTGIVVFYHLRPTGSLTLRQSGERLPESRCFAFQKADVFHRTKDHYASCPLSAYYRGQLA